VPDVVGLERLKAEGLVRQSGFRYRIVLKVTDFPADGTVLSQEPAPGEPLAPGGEVVIEVSRRPPDARVTVPDVTGMDRTTAERMLRNEGFVVRVTFGGGTPAQQGLVSGQAPLGGTVAQNRSWVEIVVVQGGGPPVLPSGGPPPYADRPAPRPPPPRGSGDLSQPPAVGHGAAGPALGTPRGPEPLPPVPLPPRDAPKTASVPSLQGLSAESAIAAVLAAGLLPILDVDRSGGAPADTVLRQAPAPGTAALPGDLVRVLVSVGARGSERFVDMPMAIGADVERARQMFGSIRTGLRVVEVPVPSHPYAGTGRVAAQYPVSSVPLSQARHATVWVVTR
jgi:beta-lactam-binding protein with PASTA domain